jgi:hypothetical protein
MGVPFGKKSYNIKSVEAKDSKGQGLPVKQKKVGFTYNTSIAPEIRKVSTQTTKESEVSFLYNTSSAPKISNLSIQKGSVAGSSQRSIDAYRGMESQSDHFFHASGPDFLDTDFGIFTFFTVAYCISIGIYFLVGNQAFGLFAKFFVRPNYQVKLLRYYYLGRIGYESAHFLLVQECNLSPEQAAKLLFERAVRTLPQPQRESDGPEIEVDFRPLPSESAPPLRSP